MRMMTVFLLIIVAGCLNTTPPTWKTCSPREDSTHLSDLDTLIFACTCFDADGDSLTYTWLVDGEIMSTENTFTFAAEAGTYTVEVMVSDGEHQISRLWNVWIIESIDIEPLIQFIEEFRGLKFEEEPEWKYYTRQEHTKYFSDQLEYIRKETEESGKFFTAIHVWNPEKDFFQECIKSSVGIGGMYSYKEKVFYEVIDPNMPLIFRRVVVLEELSHTLANQYFDIDAATEDQWLAINVLIEGEGEFVKREYIKTLSTEEFLIIQNYKPETAVGDIDPLLLAMLVYPYGFGELFVGYLLDEGGWELVDEAYRNPPESTEQVIHPEKFLMREKPIPMPIPDIPGWNVLERDVLGEGFYSIILRTYLPMDEVDRAVSGWGGDTYCLFERWDGSIMVLNTAWDTARDAGEFLNSYLHFTEEWSNGYTVLEEDPGRMLLLAQNTFVLIVYSDIYVLVIESESEENVKMAELIMEEQE